MARSHHIVAGLVLLFLVMPVWGQKQVAGRISDLKGKVSLVRNHTAAVALHKGDEIQVEDSIMTDVKSSAKMRMPDGSTLQIFPNSHVELRPETGNWKEFLHIWLGNVRVQIEKLSGRPNPKVTTTPTAIIAVRGTIFAVAVEQNGDTEVGLEKGLIGVASQIDSGKEVLVKPGQEVWVRHGEHPSQPQRMQRPMPGLPGAGFSGMGGRGTAATGQRRSPGGSRRGPSM